MENEHSLALSANLVRYHPKASTQFITIMVFWHEGTITNCFYKANEELLSFLCSEKENKHLIFFVYKSFMLNSCVMISLDI